MVRSSCDGVSDLGGMFRPTRRFVRHRLSEVQPVEKTLPSSQEFASFSPPSRSADLVAAAMAKLVLALLVFCCSALAFQAAPLHVRTFSTRSFSVVPIFAREGDGDGMGGAVGGAVLGGLLAGP